MSLIQSYSNDVDENKRWVIGGDFPLSDNSSIYSELQRWTEEEEWIWATGLQIIF
jgi:hypothetical protein